MVQSVASPCCCAQVAPRGGVSEAPVPPRGQAAVLCKVCLQPYDVAPVCSAAHGADWSTAGQLQHAVGRRCGWVTDIIRVGQPAGHHSNWMGVRHPTQTGTTNSPHGVGLHADLHARGDEYQVVHARHGRKAGRGAAPHGDAVVAPHFLQAFTVMNTNIRYAVIELREPLGR